MEPESNLVSQTSGEVAGTPSPSDSQYIPPGYQSSPFYFSRLLLIRWEDENTHCFQVEENGVCVARRRDNNMINGTKLLNVAKMTRGKRDAILKNETCRVVVKSGSMILKGVWIPFERAKQMATEHKIFEMLYPLFEDDIYDIYASTLRNRRSSFVFGSNRWMAASSHQESLLPHEALALRSMESMNTMYAPTLSTNVIPNHPRTLLHHKIQRTLSDNLTSGNYLTHNSMSIHPYSMNYSGMESMKRKFSHPEPAMHNQYPFLPLPNFGTPLPYSLPESIEEYPQTDPFNQSTMDFNDPNLLNQPDSQQQSNFIPQSYYLPSHQLDPHQ